MTFTNSMLANEQIKLEIEMKQNGIDRFLKEEKRCLDKSPSELGYFRRLTSEFVSPMVQAINAYIEYYSHRGGNMVSYPMLKASCPDSMAVITIKTIFDMLEGEGKIMPLALEIGSRVEDETRFAFLKSQAPAYIEKLEKDLKKRTTMQREHHKKVLLFAEKSLSEREHEGKKTTPWKAWDKKTKVHLGATLIKLFCQSVTLEGNAVIYQQNIRKAGKTTLHFRPTKALLSWINEYKKQVSMTLSPALAPCVIPPRDWVSPFEGGYHIQEISETLPMVKGRKGHVKKLTYNQMPEVYECINYLQSVPWTINSQVLKVAESVLDKDLALALPSFTPYDIPAAPVPEHLRELRGKELKEAMTTEEFEAFTTWKRKCTYTYERENTRRGNAISALRVIGQARKYKDYPSIYFVYKTDNRGRYYPVSDGISPQGNDLQKALIQYQESKELGSTVDMHGLTTKDWFYIVGANLWGFDKETLEDRVHYVEQLTDLFLDIAADPVTFTEWAGADKPFSFLAWCFEFEKLHAHMDDGKDYSTFSTCLRGGMDGSCSGIQHYSAMLKDEVGGQAVNLVPADKPNDIYRVVAELAESKNKESNQLVDIKWLNISGGITRTMCKKPVMTLPYGSSMRTCRNSIEAYLAKLADKEEDTAKREEREIRPVHGFSKDDYKDAITHETKIVWQSIGETVIKAREAMSFIQKLASAMAKRGLPLVWVTPSGFLVEQKIYTGRSRKVKLMLDGVQEIYLREETTTLSVSAMKSSSAPNFVHSYDATHVTKVANAMRKAGLIMSCIHDDFETHISDIPKLNSTLREELVLMYSENELEKLLHVNESLACEDLGLRLPSQGGLDLEKVKESKYTFA